MNAWSDDASAPYENSIRAWSFEEVDQSTVEQILDAQDPLKNALDNLADKYESLQGGTAPGEYVKANVDAFKALYEDYLGQSAAGGLTAAQKQTMAEELTAAYDKAVSEKNTFADGTYRIVSAAKTDAKYALYVAEDGALKWKAYDEANAKQFVFDVKNLGTTYTFDGQPHEQFSLQNLATNLYVSSGKMEQNSANNERSITADFMKMKLQHQYSQEDKILEAQLNAGADTVKAEAEIQKANIGVEKELLSLDREKMKTAQAFAQPVKEGK